MRQTDRDLRLFVTERNSRHFKSVLAAEPSTSKREILGSLLAAAERELAKIKALRPDSLELELNPAVSAPSAGSAARRRRDET